MRSLVRPEHVVAALEQMYAGRGSTLQAWAEAFVPTLRPLFRRSGVAALTVGLAAPRELLAMALDSPPASNLTGTMASVFMAMGPETLERHYRTPRPVMRMSELDPTPPEIADIFARLGGTDAVGLLCEPEPGMGVAAYVVTPEVQPPTAAERALLTRVTLHVEAAVRLLRRPDAVVGYVTPEGRVELGGAAGDVRASALGATAQGIDRARTQKHRGDGEGALSVWPALVSGRLSLAERVDTDGKRLYDLYENAPKHEALRALTEREGTVVHECARGLSNKEVSYALGISQAAVSQALASAAHKLGLTSVRAMVRLVSGLRGAGGTVASIEKLSASERVVLALVAEGKSNAQIARARGSAERTVANQVAAILRKTGARSRRELSVGQT